MSDDKRIVKDWGRCAVSLPGWRWMPGMLHVLLGRVMEVEKRGEEWWVAGHNEVLDWWPKFSKAEQTYEAHVAITEEGCTFETRDGGSVPDPYDPATAGCLEYMLGGPVAAHAAVMADPIAALMWHRGHPGLARIAAAEALGRWPGGEE